MAAQAQETTWQLYRRGLALALAQPWKGGP